jgi:hypothetical protein
MKITMYELYGRIYEENPPKHIKVYGNDWYWNNYDGYVTKESLKTTPDAQNYLMDLYRTFMNLDKEVEIIEEEKKIPEKLPYYSLEKIQKAKNKDEWREERISLLEKRVNDLHIKMNDLLDYLKSKGE